jgi:hypothetical protein
MRLSFLSVFPVLLAVATAHGQTVESQPKGGFVASLTGLQTSVGNNGLRFLTATIHFKNRSDKPIILVCEPSKVSASDDQGNRYAGATVRGLGTVAGSSVDTKFVLAPGAGADALFELRTRLSAQTVRGVTFSLDAPVREVVPLPSGQVRLGTEHALEFANLKPDGLTPDPQRVATPEGMVDAGEFTAKIVRSAKSRAGNRQWMILDMTVRLTNTSDKPLTLAYEQTSSYGIDDQGNRFGYGVAGTHDTSTSGIGLASSSTIDPQLTLAPGESKEVHLSVRRAPGREDAGTRLTYYVALVGVETLPSGQLRTTRQYSLAFPGLDCKM